MTATRASLGTFAQAARGGGGGGGFTRLPDFQADRIRYGGTDESAAVAKWYRLFARTILLVANVNDVSGTMKFMK